MAQLDEKTVKKLETGELIGTIATYFCGAVLVCFIVLFSLARVWDNALLEIILWATAPTLLAIGIAVAAFCNLKYGKSAEKLINKYVLQVLVENAGLMHPERSSLSFYFDVAGKTVEITVNAYKEKIILDFSAFKRFSAFRKMTVLRIISDRLAATFCRLYERGADYKSVDYRQTDSAKHKTGKIVKIISDGVPDKKIMKNYLKNR